VRQDVPHRQRTNYVYPMLILLPAVFSTLYSMFRSRAALALEHVALRHQIGVLTRSARKRPTLTPADRLVGVFLPGLQGLSVSPPPGGHPTSFQFPPGHYVGIGFLLGFLYKTR
jgi:hypothetical protein